MVLGDEGSGNTGRSRGRMEEERKIKKRRRREEEGRRREEGKEERMIGWGGAVFLAMQVLEIPAGGHGFPPCITLNPPSFCYCRKRSCHFDTKVDLWFRR